MARGGPSVRLPGGRRALWFAAPLAVLAAAGAWAERSGWLYVWSPGLAPPALTRGPDGAALEGELLHVRDGDTVEVRYGDLPLALRLRCVDTAESVHPDATRNSDAGAAASAWAKQRLAGARVHVEFVRRGWAIDTDRHGRAIAWLWVLPGDGAAPLLFNEELIRAGHSRYEIGFGHGGPYHARLQAAEDAARQARRGLWAGSR